MSQADAVLAHGIASAEDLPLPLSYAVVGATVALVLSFLLLGTLWRTPRLRGDEAGVPIHGMSRWLDSPPARLLLRVAGLIALGYVLIAACLGADLATNPTFGVVYVLLWAGLLPSSVLLGPWWRRVNPVRTIFLLAGRLLRVPLDRGLRPLPASLGYWPAAGALAAFVWLELAAPGRDTLTVIRAWFTLYLVLQLLAGAVYGSAWFDRSEAFEVLSQAWSRLSPWGRRPDGEVVLRNPLDTAAGWAPAPGSAAVAVVLLGSTGYDSFSGSRTWLRISAASPLPETLTATLGLGAVLLLVGGAYVAALTAAGRLARGGPGGADAGGLPGQFAHTLLPIAAGYFIAHYFTFVVLGGQRTLFQLSDPLVNGSDWLGIADGAVRGAWLTPALVANLQVTAILAGHVLGVVLAHDRALRLFPRPRATLSQLPLLVLMVAYTTAGLLLLFAS